MNDQRPQKLYTVLQQSFDLKVNIMEQYVDSSSYARPILLDYVRHHKTGIVNHVWFNFYLHRFGSFSIIIEDATLEKITPK